MIRWSHQKGPLLKNVPVTKGEKVASSIGAVILGVAISPILVVAGVVAAPIYAFVYGVDAIDNSLKDRAHKQKMKKCWRYRLAHTTKKMDSLAIWQRDMGKYDQYVRKMLAIRELGDLPYEVWTDLLDSSLEYERFAKMVGSTEYTEDVQVEVVENAMMFYTKAYMELHRIESFETAKSLVGSILMNEMI
jgi:hypothetical protein